MKEIVFVTGNPGKVQEVERFLGLPLKHVAVELEELQSIDPESIVRRKAEAAFGKLGVPLLVEDTSVVFTALNRLPGPFIKYFEEELGQEGLCRLLDGKDRSCVATARFAFHDGAQVHVFEGSMPGSVADTPRGTRSFGWASIVVPEGKEKTYAEMSDEEQAEVAMRKKALLRLREALASLY
ncbi:MAG TPA: non-canonical purine NTP pyrophosphatase [Candidatus Paceibacterota bacterium]